MARDFLRRIYEKAAEDQIFYMAGAIAFNVVVAIVPLLLAVLGIAGTILRLQGADATEPLLRYLIGSLPPVSPAFEQTVRQMLRDLTDKSTGFLSIGTVFLIWVATRLVATLRATLREVFEVQQDRSLLRGKLFDLKFVIAAGTLFALNVAVTVGLEVVAHFGLGFLGLDGAWRGLFHGFYARAVAVVSIWVMFLLIYRYLPARRITWRTAVVAATFTAVLFELLKLAFSWYVVHVADYGSTYGNLATLVILIFWIYYTAVAFILGGEVGQIVAMRRIRRRQRERLR